MHVFSRGKSLSNLESADFLADIGAEILRIASRQ